MKLRVIEASTFCLIAVAVHATAFIVLGTGTADRAAPSGAALTMASADRGTAELVAAWQAPPEQAGPITGPRSPGPEPGPTVPSIAAALPMRASLPPIAAPAVRPVPPVTPPEANAAHQPEAPQSETYSPNLPAQATTGISRQSALPSLRLPSAPAAPPTVQVPVASLMRRDALRADPEIPSSSTRAPVSRAPETSGLTAPLPDTMPPDLPEIDRRSTLPPATDLAVARSERPPARPARSTRAESATPSMPSSSSQSQSQSQSKATATAAPSRKANPGRSDQGEARPAASGLSSSQRKTLMGQWGQRIGAQIQRRAPHVGRSTRVVVQLTVMQNGRLVSAGVSRSSGDPRVDRAALSAVRKAGRFPRAPAALPGDSHVFSLPIRFR